MSSPGGTSARGYGTAHQRERKRWFREVAAGGVACRRCGQVIRRGEPWDLGHVDGSGKAAYSGPEHATCNRSAGGKAGRAKQGSSDPQPRRRTRW